MPNATPSSRSSVAKRVTIAAVTVTALGVGAFTVFAWRSALPAIATAGSFSTNLVARGEVLSGAGNCAGCQTTKAEQHFAGGYGIETGFGTVYSTNITPDPEAGIGAWSETAFGRAMREGVSRDESHLFPAFPYEHFTKLTDGDVAALYSYFTTRRPIRATRIPNTLAFPLNIRGLQAGWKLAFFRPGRLQTRPNHNAVWNRGAYLAEGIAHCAACHSPHNVLGAEKRGQAYGGGIIGGREVPPLTNANLSPVPWSEEELYSYLRSGIGRYHGQAGGAMASVIRDGLAKLPDADIKALAVYFADVGGTAARAGEAKVAIERAETADRRDLSLKVDGGARLYTIACASCHYNSGGAANPQRPSIALMSAINAPDPTDLVRTILRGWRAEMSAFGTGLSDADIALIAAHLRRSRTSAAPWPDLEKKVGALRALTSTGELVK